MKKKYKLAKAQQQQTEKEESVRFHYQVYIQEEQSIHPKDEDEIEY